MHIHLLSLVLFILQSLLSPPSIDFWTVNSLSWAYFSYVSLQDSMYFDGVKYSVTYKILTCAFEYPLLHFSSSLIFLMGCPCKNSNIEK